MSQSSLYAELPSIGWDFFQYYIPIDALHQKQETSAFHLKVPRVTLIQGLNCKDAAQCIELKETLFKATWTASETDTFKTTGAIKAAPVTVVTTKIDFLETPDFIEIFYGIAPNAAIKRIQSAVKSKWGGDTKGFPRIQIAQVEKSQFGDTMAALRKLGARLPLEEAEIRLDRFIYSDATEQKWVLDYIDNPYL
jgi:hypothetical protein